MQKYIPYLVALIGSILLWAAWPTSPLTFLLFVAFIPLFWLEDTTASTKKLFAVTYLHMFLWNGFTTWWIYNASAFGALMAIIANSALMCLPLLMMRLTKRKMGRLAGYLSFVSLWISYEYLHHNWELSWPWLTLGNGFAMQPAWVQWYEATGTTGGTLWVLLTNILGYQLFKQIKSKKGWRQPAMLFAALALLISIPVIISYNILSAQQAVVSASAKNATKNIVVVQPNVDPYNEKFMEGTQEAQVQRLIALSEQKIDSNTALVIWPETAIPVGVREDQIRENYFYQPVWSFLQRHPRLSLLSGIDSYRIYGSNKESASSTARYSKEENIYYDAFNAAAMLYPDNNARFYHKAKLVPGVETLPSFLLWLSDIFDDFGGTSGTLGRDKERAVLPDQQHYFVAAPIICYESIYSEYVTDYVRKGANVLAIMTNDGWWGNTEGHRQHMNYARLRAIETRRWIARSANTGISCFLDPTGEIYQPQPWDTPAVIKMNVEPLQSSTFYVLHGDYLSKFFNIISAILLIILPIIIFKQRSLR